MSSGRALLRRMNGHRHSSGFVGTLRRMRYLRWILTLCSCLVKIPLASAVWHRGAGSPTRPKTAVRSACFLRWRKDGGRRCKPRLPWKSFLRAEDFLRLKDKYGVGWVVVQAARKPPASIVSITIARCECAEFVELRARAFFSRNFRGSGLGDQLQFLTGGS